MSIPPNWEPNQQLLSLAWAWVARGWKLFDDDCIVCHSPDNDLSDNDTIRIGSSFHQKGIFPRSKDWEKEERGQMWKESSLIVNLTWFLVGCRTKRVNICIRRTFKQFFGLRSLERSVCCKEKFKLSQSSCQSLDRLRKYVKVQPFKPRHNLHYSI